MMAAPPETSLPLYDADRVGNAFVQQYYRVLRETPQHVYKFYTDASKMTRAECGPYAVVDTVTTQQKIYDKVMSKDYGNLRAEILSVDSQQSLNGGVLVIVTGSLSESDVGKRKFLQSFFLAPQEKGFYVLNDIFRYLDEAPQHVKHALPNNIPNGISEISATPVLPEQVPIMPVAEHVVHEVMVDEHPEELVETDVSEVVEPTELNPTEEAEEYVEVEEELTGEVGIQDTETAATVVDVPSQQPLPEPDATTVEIAQEEASGDKPKKFSYASVLTMKQAGIQLPQQPQAQPSPARPAEASNRASPFPATDVSSSEPQAAAPIQPPPPSTPAAVPIEENLEDASTTEVEAAAPPQENRYNERDARSVFLKNLPLQITNADLAEIVQQFGTVKLNHIQIRGKAQNTNSCFAFVEFEDMASAQAAVEKGTITVGTFLVRIEEKRAMGVNKSYRGGRGGQNVRGDRPFRNDNNLRMGRGQAYGGGGRMGGRGQPGPDRGGERDGPQNRSRGPGGGPGRPGPGGPNLQGPSGQGQGQGQGLGQAGERGIGGEPVRRTGGEGMGSGSRGARRGGGTSGHGGPRGGGGGGGGPPRGPGPVPAAAE